MENFWNTLEITIFPFLHTWFINYNYYLIPFFAFLLDAILGDPRSKFHPVVGIGKIISIYEHLFYSSNDTNQKKFMYGMMTALMTLFTILCIGGIILFIGGLISPWVEYILEVILVYISISPKSLAQAGNELASLLRNQNIKQARVKVGWIVGRKTDELDESEITRATIETIAENTVDGIVSPLLFFAVFGPLGAVFYRAANTLDSMLGYKNDKYLFFGRFAAKFDDLTNFIPARISFVLFVVAAWIRRFDYKKAWYIGLRDAKKHPSPNGGYAEAPVAGALHIRLGGFNQYFDKVTFREYMGDPLNKMKGIHIKKTISLMYTVTLEALILSSLIAYWLVKL